MTPEQLLKQMREQRMRWVDVPADPVPKPPAELPADPAAPIATRWVPPNPPATGARAIRLLCPSEEQMVALVQGGGLSVGIDDVRKYTEGWRGFTEADLLGAAVGAAEPVPFDTAIYAEWIGNQLATSQHLVALGR